MRKDIIFAPISKSKDYTPSKFVTACIAKIRKPPNNFVLDLPSGYGRHTFLFSGLGYYVVSADIDERALASITANRLAIHHGEIEVAHIDASRTLPFTEGQFGIVVIVHFVLDGLLEKVDKVLASGGYLILETFSGNGGNWRSLPEYGAIEKMLIGRYEIIDLKEKNVGPIHLKKSTVKLFAKKIPIPGIV